MSKTDNKIPIGIQIDATLNARLNECAKAEKRTKRAVVEIALEEYIDKSEKNYKKQLEDN